MCTGLISVEVIESRKEARLYPEISIHLCVIVGGSADLSEFFGCPQGGLTKKIGSLLLRKKCPECNLVGR